MSDLHSRLRADLTTVMRARDRDAVRVLRTVLSAIANAEAQPVDNESPVSLTSDGPIAGAVEGLASAEVDRRELTEPEVRAIVEAELAERLAAVGILVASGATDSAEVLRHEARFLDRYLLDGRPASN